MSMHSAIRKGLKAAIDAASLGVSVYDGAPSTVAFPFIEIANSRSMPDDADCIVGRQVSTRLHIWGRDQGRLQPTEVVADAVYNALHEATITLDDPYACVNCRVDFCDVFIDEDGITAHGVVDVDLLVEDKT